MSTQEILDQVCLSRYLSDRPDQLKILTEKMTAVLEAQNGQSHAEHVLAALHFMEELWGLYTGSDLIRVYKTYVGFETAISGLEDNLGSGDYRDHFVHMFNTLVFGLRFISSVLKQVDERTAHQMFKIRKEQVRHRIPNYDDYGPERRLYYLWVLISTFHDIGIPIEHLRGIGAGMSAFTELFEWQIVAPTASAAPFEASLLYEYLTLLSAIFKGGLKTNDQGYDRHPKGCHYLTQFLGRAFDRRDHGVVGGFLMWRFFECMNLSGRSTKPLKTADEFDAYHELISEQDNARAALAISLHNLKEDSRKGTVAPKILPLKFSQYPLTFLLILADELQEYLRWEGHYTHEAISIKGQPGLDVKVAEGIVDCVVTFEVADELVVDTSERIDRIQSSLQDRLAFGEDLLLKIVLKSTDGADRTWSLPSQAQEGRSSSDNN